MFNGVSKVIQDCIGFTQLCSVIGLKKLVPSFNQSDAKLKQSRFPACFHFEFSLANDDVNLCFDWSL